MNTNTQTKPWLRLCTGALAAGGVAASMLGLASGTAQAAPPPAPMITITGARATSGTRAGALTRTGTTAVTGTTTTAARPVTDHLRRGRGRCPRHPRGRLGPRSYGTPDEQLGILE